MHLDARYACAARPAFAWLTCAHRAHAAAHTKHGRCSADVVSAHVVCVSRAHTVMPVLASGGSCNVIYITRHDANRRIHSPLFTVFLSWTAFIAQTLNLYSSRLPLEELGRYSCASIGFERVASLLKKERGQRLTLVGGPVLTPAGLRGCSGLLARQHRLSKDHKVDHGNRFSKR